jgi:hypothetical protein
MTITARLIPLVIAIVTLVVGGCSGNLATRSNESEPIVERDYAFSVSDIPAERRFKLTLEAKSRRLICTGKTRWPTGAGYMENASNKVSVIVGDRKYAYRDFEMDVCPFKACGNPVSNGMRLESSLFYRDFDLPEALYDAPKKLSYDLRPFWCDTAHWIDTPRQ